MRASLWPSLDGISSVSVYEGVGRDLWHNRSHGVTQRAVRLPPARTSCALVHGAGG